MPGPGPPGPVEFGLCGKRGGICPDGVIFIRFIYSGRRLVCLRLSVAEQLPGYLERRL